jgi:hypothetical protein
MSNPNTVPVAVKTPNNGNATISSAQTSTAGVGSTLVWSAGTEGSLISRAYFTVPLADGASTIADAVRLFKYDGTNYFMCREAIVPVQACTIAGGTGSYTADFSIPTPWVEKSPLQLFASTVKGQSTKVMVEAGDYS